MKKIVQEAELLKAMAHPTRLLIVKKLMCNECNVTKIVNSLKISQSSVSKHISILRMKGIIEGQKSGLEVCYKLTSEKAKKILRALNSPSLEKKSKKGRRRTND